MKDTQTKTTIQIFAKDKARLDALKVHPSQPIREVVRLLLEKVQR